MIRKNVHIKIIFLFLTMIILSSNFLPFDIIVGNTTRDYWPTEDWQISSPEEQEMNSRLINKMDKEFDKSAPALDSFILIRHEYIVYERYFGEFNETSLHEIFSITKSVTSCLIGIAIDENYLQLTDKMVDFFPDKNINNNDELKQSITIEHLLTMTSGLDYSETLHLGQFLSANDSLQYILDKPMSSTPGKVFNYNTASTQILTAILQNLTGKTVYEFAQEKLFSPLGITNVFWDCDCQGINYGGYGLSMLPRDLAKFGYLFLNNGTWDNSQIISSDWVNCSSASYIEVYPEIEYGYLWWLYPEFKTYCAQGFLGQNIFVFPDNDLILVNTAHTFDSASILSFIEDYILPSLSENQNASISFLPIIPIIFIALIIYRKRKVSEG